MKKLAAPRGRGGQAAKIELFCECEMDGRGRWRWHVVARNGRLVATSGEAFYSRASAARAVRALMRTFARGVAFEG